MAKKPGRVIDTWELTVMIPGATEHARHTSLKVKVPVRMEAGQYETKFFVDFHHGEHRCHLWDKDINSLKSQTAKWLAGVVTFKWEDFLRVHFAGSFDNGKDFDDVAEGYDGDLRSPMLAVKFSYDYYQVAKNAEGESVYRDLSGRLNGGRVTIGEPDLDPPFWDGGKDALIALVPRTSENEVALQAIFDGFRELSDKLKKLLSPDTIQASLAAIAKHPKALGAQQLLLPGPKPPKKAKKAIRPNCQ